MKKALKWIGVIVGSALVLAAFVLLYARSKAMAAYERTWSVEDHPIPIPFPLTDDEIAALRADRAAADPTADDPLVGVDLEAIAHERAVERGRRLVTTRLGCHDCHGEDFGGHVVMDVLPVGALIAPNITEGQGSATQGYAPADWVRILRHGVGRDRQTSVMPAIDYSALSDQEISDVASYVRSFPPVDREMEPSRMGPVLWMQVGFGEAPPSAFLIDHDAPRPVRPPTPAPTADYGRHLAQVCTGCHGSNFAGGPIRGGDPSWPEAANLTPDATGLAGWTYEDYDRVFRDGVNKGGQRVRFPMPWQLMAAMSDLEKQAMFAFFMSLPATPKGQR